MDAQPARPETELRYVRVKWVHNNPDEPVYMYYELNREHWAVRVLEVYGDGSAESVDPNLLDAPLPPLKEINAAREFQASEISKEAFETEWKKQGQGT